MGMGHGLWVKGERISTCLKLYTPDLVLKSGVYYIKERVDYMSSKESTPKVICIWESSLQSCSMASTLATIKYFQIRYFRILFL